jgi:hypothetical protein
VVFVDIMSRRYRRNPSACSAEEALDAETSPRRLLSCAQAFPEEVLANPALALIGLEAPEAWGQIVDEAWYFLPLKRMSQVCGAPFHLGYANWRPAPPAITPAVARWFVGWAMGQLWQSAGVPRGTDIEDMESRLQLRESGVEPLIIAQRPNEIARNAFRPVVLAYEGHWILLGQLAERRGEDLSQAVSAARQASVDALARRLGVRLPPWPKHPYRPNRARR